MFTRPLSGSLEFYSGAILNVSEKFRETGMDGTIRSPGEHVQLTMASWC